MSNNSLFNKTILLSSAFVVLTGCGGGESTKTPGGGSTNPLPPAAQLCTGSALGDDQVCVTTGSRESILYKPSDAPDGIALFLHGAPGSASKVMSIFDAKMVADTHNLVAVAPKGNVQTWGWLSRNETSQTSNEDVDFITELLTQVVSEHNVTSDKVYVFGYSAGGFMAYTLACHIPEQLTGVIALAGQYRGDFAACSTSTPTRIHHMHSLSDNDVPYDGRNFGAIQSVNATIAHWLNKNGCNETFETVEQQGVTNNSSGTTTQHYDNCAASLSLSKMANVPHEASYLPERLYELYGHLLSND
ncbi:alpha/beta hydrolase family esterase [Thalassotalea fusca]